MALLMSFRRYWAVFFFSVLVLPTIGFFAPDLPAPLRTVTAPAESWWLRASERLDPYINNVFGFRGAVLAAHDRYVRWLGVDGERVMKGEGGALFIKDQQAVEQSIGQLVRPWVVEQVADVASRLGNYMKSIGGRFVMVVPPNGQTVNWDRLPAYARDLRRAPTEYDLLAKTMAARGVPFVDLRPVMAEARKDGPVYRLNDTHWNDRGAVLGFNATMKALGRPDLAFDPADVLGPPRERFDGDLVRLIGATKAEVPDVDYPRKGAMVRREDLTPIPDIATQRSPKDPFQPQVYETGHAGPRIMVIGDSFTQNFWPGFLAARASAYMWTHHRSCGFDMQEVERFRPDILIYAPAERSLPCRAEK